MTTNVDLVNRALAESGERVRISSMTDGSTQALYASILYPGTRDFLLAEGDYQFAATTTVPTEQTDPIFPWSHVYAYPTDAVRIRQLIPSVVVLLDPQPVEWNIYSTPTVKLIASYQPIALINYTSNGVVETLWDPLFTETFVRLLGSALIYALSNRIEASKERLNEALSFAGVANMRDT